MFEPIFARSASATTPSEQDAQLSQRHRAAVFVSFGQKVEHLELRDNNFTNIIGLSSTTVTQSVCKAIEFDEKRKRRAITPCKVIQGHRCRYQAKALIRLPISD